MLLLHEQRLKMFSWSRGKSASCVSYVVRVSGEVQTRCLVTVNVPRRVELAQETSKCLTNAARVILLVCASICSTAGRF